MYTRPHQSATHAVLTSRCSIRRRSSHVRSLTTKGMDCMNCGKLQHGRDSVFSNVMVATAVWTHRLLKSTRISLCAFLFYCSERRSCRLAGINPNRIQTSKTKFVSFWYGNLNGRSDSNLLHRKCKLDESFPLSFTTAVASLSLVAVSICW